MRSRRRCMTKVLIQNLKHARRDSTLSDAQSAARKNSATAARAEHPAAVYLCPRTGGQDNDAASPRCGASLLQWMAGAWPLTHFATKYTSGTCCNVKYTL